MISLRAAERRARSPSLPNGDLHLDMGRSNSGNGSDMSCSTEDERAHRLRRERLRQRIDSWGSLNNFLINFNRAADVDAYCTYVEQLTEVDPRIQSVVDYFSIKRLHEQCANCTFLDCTLISFEPGGQPKVSFRFNPRTPFDKQAFEVETEALGQAIMDSSPRKVLICEDLQPEGAKFLGAFLSLEPYTLEYYINRDASFESKSTQAHVFDYPETYHSDKMPRFKDEHEFLVLRDHARPCTLLRMWKDVYSLFQRVVWVVVFNREANTYLHLILLDSPRVPRDRSATRISSSLPSFRDWKANRASPLPLVSQKSFREELEQALLSAKIADQAGIDPDNHELEIKATPEIHQVITSLLRSKWSLMIGRAQESISESKAPLTGELDDIAEVLQRKHDFEKLKRSLSALITSVKRIPTMAQHRSPGVAELMLFESSLESWAAQLEKVSQSLLGLLAVSESKRATEQAVRSKNLQLLAFVFIPISTVSSIYGMNTVEILGTPPRNWNVVVGAIVAIAASALTAIIYSSWLMTTIFNNPLTFLLDVLLLGLSIMLKTLAGLVILAATPLLLILCLASLPLGLALWIALGLPGWLLYRMAELLGLSPVVSCLEGAADFIASVTFKPFFGLLMAFIRPAWLTYRSGKVWEFLYFYDIRHPFTMPGKTKTRHQRVWNQVKPKEVESKLKRPETTKCVVM